MSQHLNAQLGASLDTQEFRTSGMQREFYRRVESIRQLLIGLLLSSRQELVSTNQILGHLTLLVQQPLLMVVYESKEQGGDFSLVSYFDYEKTIKARGASITLVRRDQESEKLETTLPATYRDHLFPIFVRYNDAHQFFLRVFRMEEVPGNVSKFHEVRNPFNGTAPVALTTVDHYIAASAAALFSFSKADYDAVKAEHFDRSILGEVTKIVGRVLNHQRWKRQGDRRSQTLVPFEQQYEVETYGQDFFGQLRAKDGELDRLYRRISGPTSLIKKFAGTNDGQPSVPDVFFAFRSYDRDSARCVRSGSSGFAHNLRFVLPERQKSDLRKTLLSPEIKMRLQESESFSSIERDEFTGLRLQLDHWFWAQVADGANDGFAEIFRVFESPIGSGALSLLEPAFYAGVPGYRYPFRREGGFDRIPAVGESLARFCAAGNKASDFDIAHIEAGTEALTKEARDDVRRVVVAYYLFLMFAPGIVSRSRHWTTVLLFPIEVCGAISAVVGTVLFRPIISNTHPEALTDVFAAAATQRWNTAMYFYKDVYLAAARDIRRMYRDSQIKLICDELAPLVRAADIFIPPTSSNTPYVADKQGADDADGVAAELTEEAVKTVLDALESSDKKFSKLLPIVARFNPYPQCELVWVPTATAQNFGVRVRIIRTALPGWVLVLSRKKNPIFKQDFAGMKVVKEELQTPGNGDNMPTTDQEASDTDLMERAITANVNAAFSESSIQAEIERGIYPPVSAITKQDATLH